MKFSHRVMIVIFILAILFAISFTLLVGWKTHERLHATQTEWVESLINAIAENITRNVIDKNKLELEAQLSAIVNKETTIDYAFIVDFEGNLFAHTFTNNKIPRFLIPRLDSNIKNSQDYYVSQNILTDIAHPLIEGMDAKLHFGVNHTEIDQLIESSKKEIISISLMIGLLGTFVAVFLGNKISAPLNHLRSEMQLYGQGKEISHVKLATRDKEFLDLASTFNSMIYDRGMLESAYKKSEAHIRLLMNSTAEGIFGLDLKGNCIFANKSCLKLLGYDNEEELLNKHMHHLMHHSYEDGTSYPVEDCPVHKGNSKGEKIHIYNEVFWRKNGSSFPVEYFSHPIIEKNKYIGVVITFFDISKRREIERELKEHQNFLEQKVAERTIELETTMKELESFSYSVSHDLRAPLRGIKGFSQVLLEDYKEALDDEGQDLLNRIASGAQNMSVLIDELLSLAQISKHNLKKKSVNLSNLSINIIHHLQEQDSNRSANVQIQNDIIADCDEKLAEIALTNLLSNAWKFTQKVSHPVIAFGMLQHQELPVYYIKDNGAGFNMEFVDKIFGAFQRLHNKNEFEGTGIGLATVSRIIHRHGGQVWAQSKIDNGSTFYFTLKSGDVTNFQEK